MKLRRLLLDFVQAPSWPPADFGALGAPDLTVKIGFVSLGCPKNLVDSEVMLGLAEQAGHEITADAEDADVLVVNTCAFIDRAKQESIDTILEMAELKKQAAGRTLVVTGCLAERYRDELQKEIPEIDAVSAPARCRGSRGPDVRPASDPAQHGQTVLQAARTHRRLPCSASTCRPTSTTPTRRATRHAGHYAYVKIAEGCDYKCAFCIIPKMRGHYRSRPIESIVAEAQRSPRRASRSCCSSRRTRRSTASIAASAARCRAAARAERRRRPRVDSLLYLYPTTISDDVIDAIAELDKVCKYIDLPLQHASDAVLKRMKRPGTRASYEKLLREHPRAHSRTSRCAPRSSSASPAKPTRTSTSSRRSSRTVGFDHVGVFTYSHEEGTTAPWPDRRRAGGDEEKRQDRLMARQRDRRRAQQRRLGERARWSSTALARARAGAARPASAGQAPDIDPQVYLTECDPSANPSRRLHRRRDRRRAGLRPDGPAGRRRRGGSGGRRPPPPRSGRRGASAGLTPC